MADNLYISSQGEFSFKEPPSDPENHWIRFSVVDGKLGISYRGPECKLQPIDGEEWVINKGWGDLLTDPLSPLRFPPFHKHGDLPLRWLLEHPELPPLTKAQQRLLEASYKVSDETKATVFGGGTLQKFIADSEAIAFWVLAWSHFSVPLGEHLALEEKLPNSVLTPYQQDAFLDHACILAGNDRVNEFLGKPSWVEAVDSVFGVKDRAIRRELSKLSIAEIILLMVAKNIFTPDEWRKICATPELSDVLRINQSLLAGCFGPSFCFGEEWQKVSFNTRIRILREGCPSHLYSYPSDVSNMLRFLKPTKPVKAKNLQKLHDQLFKMPAEMFDFGEEQERAPLPEVIENAGKLIDLGRTLSAQRIEEYKDFLQTAGVLHNCLSMGGFYQKTLSGDSYCYSIREGDELIGALEIGAPQYDKPPVLLQMYGPRNSTIRQGKSIISALREKFPGIRVDRFNVRV